MHDPLSPDSLPPESPCCGCLFVDATTDDEFECGVETRLCRGCGQRYRVVDVELDDDCPPPSAAAARATDAPAGSEEKIVAMASRHARGQHLYHPGDNSEVGRAAPSGQGCGKTPEARAAAREARRGLPRGVRRYRSGFRAEAWDKERKDKVDLGVHATVAEAERAAERGRQDLAEAAKKRDAEEAKRG